MPYFQTLLETVLVPSVTVNCVPFVETVMFCVAVGAMLVVVVTGVEAIEEAAADAAHPLELV